MATRAEFTVTKVSGSADALTNASKVKVVLKIITTGESWNANDTTRGYISIDGVQVASLDKKRFYKNSTTTIYNATHSVQHEADGTKTVKVAYEFDTHISAGVLRGDETLTLDTIQRVTLPSVPVVTLGQKATIPVNVTAGLSYSLRYTLGSKSGVIKENSTAGSVDWTPPAELASELSGASGKGKLTLTAYINEAPAYSVDYDFTVLVPDSLGPVIKSFTHAFRAENAAVAGWGVGVKGKTKLGYTVSAEGQYGASIESCIVSFAGATGSGLSGETGATAQVGTFRPKVTVTDSRGKSTTMEGSELTVYDYSAPSFISSNAYRADENGNALSNGTYVAVTAAASFSPVGGYNSTTLKMRSRVVDGAWGAYSELNAQQINVLPGFSESLSYEVEVVAVDAVGESKSVTYVIPTEDVAFNIKDGGKGAAFGKYATEDNVLDVDWNLRVMGKLLLDWMYPVGSIYLAYSHDNPAELFGGTWVRIENAFLWAIDEKGRIGITGGEVDHMLTVDELPSHSHTTYRTMSAGSGSAIYVPSQSGTASGVETTAVGGGQAHNNMPPFIQVSAWRRTA